MYIILVCSSSFHLSFPTTQSKRLATSYSWTRTFLKKEERRNREISPHIFPFGKIDFDFDISKSKKISKKSAFCCFEGFFFFFFFFFFPPSSFLKSRNRVLFSLQGERRKKKEEEERKKKKKKEKKKEKRRDVEIKKIVKKKSKNKNATAMATTMAAILARALAREGRRSGLLGGGGARPLGLSFSCQKSLDTSTSPLNAAQAACSTSATSPISTRSFASSSQKQDNAYVYSPSDKEVPRDLAGVLDASAQTLFVTELMRGMSLALKYFFTKKVTVSLERKKKKKYSSSSL